MCINLYKLTELTKIKLTFNFFLLMHINLSELIKIVNLPSLADRYNSINT